MQIDYLNYAIGIIGLILAVVGIVLSVRSIKKKEPIYSIKSNNLISGTVSTLENLHISFKDQKIQNLTVSKILLFNGGTETIARQDIETINHLSVSSEICNILDGSILQINNPSNNISVRYETNNKNVFIDFDYLDKNQGMVIQVIHTGTSSDDINVTGSIKGVQKLIQVPSDKIHTNRPMTKSDKRFIGFIAVCSVITAYSMLSDKVLLNAIIASYPWLIGALAIFIMAIGFVGFVAPPLIFLGYVLSLFAPSSTIPQGLYKFSE